MNGSACRRSADRLQVFPLNTRHHGKRATWWETSPRWSLSGYGVYNYHNAFRTNWWLLDMKRCVVNRFRSEMWSIKLCYWLMEWQCDPLTGSGPTGPETRCWVSPGPWDRRPGHLRHTFPGTELQHFRTHHGHHLRDRDMSVGCGLVLYNSSSSVLFCSLVYLSSWSSSTVHTKGVKLNPT